MLAGKVRQAGRATHKLVPPVGVADAAGKAVLVLHVAIFYFSGQAHHIGVPVLLVVLCLRRRCCCRRHWLSCCHRTARRLPCRCRCCLCCFLLSLPVPAPAQHMMQHARTRVATQVQQCRAWQETSQAWRNPWQTRQESQNSMITTHQLCLMCGHGLDLATHLCLCSF